MKEIYLTEPATRGYFEKPNGGGHSIVREWVHSHVFHRNTYAHTNHFCPANGHIYKYGDEND